MAAMVRKLSRFLALGRRDQVELLTAWIMLGAYRFGVLILPFRWLIRSLDHSPGRVSLPQKGFECSLEAARIGELVARAGRHTPWLSTCLVQVLVVQRLLKARDIPGQLYLGARFDSSEGAPDPLAAHAWLESGGRVVNGGDNFSGYAVLSCFSWDKR